LASFWLLCGYRWSEAVLRFDMLVLMFVVRWPAYDFHQWDAYQRWEGLLLVYGVLSWCYNVTL